MSDDQKNPPAQPEFGELAPEGWSWNPEANAPHTPETKKAAEAAAKAAAKAQAAAAAARAAAAERGSSRSLFPRTPPQTPVKDAKPTRAAKAAKAAEDAKAAQAATSAPATSTPATDADITAAAQTPSPQNLSDDEKKAAALALARKQSDRFITWGLLGIAVFSVMSSLGDYVNLTRTLNVLFDEYNALQPSLALEPYANPALASFLGWVIIMGQAIAIGLTFWWAIRRMRAGKLAFWVPLVGYAVASAVVTVCLLIALAGDPAAMETLRTVDVTLLFGF
jgi:hypothetical protein